MEQGSLLSTLKKKKVTYLIRDKFFIWDFKKKII